MLINYLKVAFRNLWRRKIYTILNLVGLSTGLTCAIFIFTWVVDEQSFDQHYPDHDRMYRMVSKVSVGSDQWHQAVTSLPLGPTLYSDFDQIESFVRLDYNDAIVDNGDKRFSENLIVLTDSTFFDFFGVDMVEGNPETALREPYQLVLTSSMATKYFGDTSPIGKHLRIYQYDPDGNGVDYMITGVVADPPRNAHFQYKMLASIATIAVVRPTEITSWGNNSYYTYFKLKPGSDIQQLERKLPEFTKLYLGEDMEQFDFAVQFYPQPISTIHLHSDLMYEISFSGSIVFVNIFVAIGVLILLLAGINYINLSTATALERVREMGVRKVMGARSGNLMIQHIVETLLLTVIAMVFAGFLVELFKYYFYDLTDKHYLEFPIWDLMGNLLLVGLPVGVLAGVFPAYLLSRSQTSLALRGSVTGSSNHGLRSLLVGFQFVITLIILVGVIVIEDQMSYIQSKDLGYNKQNLLTIKINGDREIMEGFESFRSDLLQSTEIHMVARASSIITSGLGNSNAVVKHDDREQTEKVYGLRVDTEYIPTYEMEILAGRNFSQNVISDSNAFIINQKSASLFGWTEDEAIGEQMTFRGIDGKIIGVVKDFHFNSLDNPIEPVCMYIPQGNFSRIIVRGSGDQLLTSVSTAFAKHFPASLFDYTFQEQALYNTYAIVDRFGNIIRLFSGLSMLIAYLGLFGLVGYTVMKRFKEISIRKVLGAEAGQIIYIIASRFLIIIGIAAVIAFPIAWIAMDSWLTLFSYRIDLAPWHLFVSLAAILIVAFLIILSQSIKPIYANPSRTLREE